MDLNTIIQELQQKARGTAQEQVQALMDAVKHPPRTHDYTRRGWGHDYTFDPSNGGITAKMGGWGHGLRKGDYLILMRGNDTTRYQITKIRYCTNPPDMWFAEVVFAPRTKAEKGEE